MNGQQSSRGAGIAQVELYIPRLYVDMQEQGIRYLTQEQFDKVPKGKYTLELGQLKISALPDSEDSVSMALNGTLALTSDRSSDGETQNRSEENWEAGSGY